MFRDDDQLAAAIGVLLSSAPRMGRFWTKSGPTPEAVDLCAARGGPLSPAEGALLLAAFDLWNGEGGITLARLLDVGGDPLETLGSLLATMTRGYEAIDEWIATTQATITARRNETPEQKLARFRSRGPDRSGAN